MAFIDMWSELAGRIPQLDPFLAQKFINRGWQDVRNTRAWSFLFQPAQMFAPALVSGGNVTVTQGSTSVACDATAAALIDAANTAGSPPLTSRQFRFSDAGAVYGIASWTSPAGPLVLSQPFNAATGVGTWSIYQCYFDPPSSDFVRWFSIYDPNNGYQFTNMHVSQQVLNRVDPMRSSQGLAYWSSDYTANPVTGAPIYEFWPHPTQGQSYSVIYQRKGIDLSAGTDTLPGIIDENIVIERALYHAYGWASANASRFPFLKGVNWPFLRQDAIREYPKNVQRLARLDDEIFLRSIVIPSKNHGWGPIDGKFLQGHTGFGWFGWT